MLFEQIPAYLEFFGFPTTTPEELIRLAEITYCSGTYRCEWSEGRGRRISLRFYDKVEEPSVRDPWLIAEYSHEDIDRNCVFERRVEREG
jgi:lauroyl/myristoyl acyltransferase